jgi:mono/diheme cytochrome c family protein
MAWRLAIVGSILLLIAISLLGLWYVRSHGFSAREKPSALEEFVATRLRSLATTPEMRDRKNPVTRTEVLIAEARDHFVDHCAVCHANDGSGRTLLGRNMYPPAADLRADETQRLTDGEIFAIIQNGVRFTGMPGFGGEDEENWKLVHFIRHIPKLSAKEIELMRQINKFDIDPKASESKPHRHSTAH